MSKKAETYKYLPLSLAREIHCNQCRVYVRQLVRVVAENFAIFTARNKIGTQSFSVAEILIREQGWVELEGTGKALIRVARPGTSAKDRELFGNNVVRFNMVATSMLDKARADMKVALRELAKSRSEASARAKANQLKNQSEKEIRERRTAAWAKDFHAVLMGTRTARELAKQAFLQEVK